ncbi:MAG: flagellin [bacterium]
MRVTDLTKQNSIMRNIGSRGGKMQDVQDNISSGRRINTLSDDPVGATQAQDFRTSISFMNTLQANLRDNFVWLDRTESEIANLGESLRRVKTLVLSQANASANAATRRVTAEELRAIYDGMVQSGNSKIGKLFIFSGSATFTRPLEREAPIQPALARIANQDGQIVEAEQDPKVAAFEGNSSHPYRVRITRGGGLGNAFYRVSDDGGESWSREKKLVAENRLVNEDGAPSDEVVLRLNPPAMGPDGVPFEFPEGLEFVHMPNPAIRYHGNEDLRMVQTGEGILLPLNVTAQEIFFGKEGDPERVDVFSLMNSLLRALEEDQPETLRDRIDEIDRASDQVLEARANLGAVHREMNSRLDKLEDREFSKTRQLSDVEDLDLPAALVEMNLASVRNQAALDSSARLIEPTLLNFLR